MLSVVLANDHRVLRQGLRSLLEHEFGYAVVGEAADGPAAIELVVQLVPDVLVVEYHDAGHERPRGDPPGT